MINERSLTAAEKKKREEIAQAIEREQPGIDKEKKMAIATAQAKKVAEQTTFERGDTLKLEGRKATVLDISEDRGSIDLMFDDPTPTVELGQKLQDLFDRAHSDNERAFIAAHFTNASGIYNRGDNTVEIDTERASKRPGDNVDSDIHDAETEEEDEEELEVGEYDSRSVEHKYPEERYNESFVDFVTHRLNEVHHIKENAQQRDLDPNKKVVVKGVKGMKSKPFTKKFRNMAAADKWLDSDASDDHQVSHIMNESINEATKKVDVSKVKVGQRILSDDRNHDPLEVTGKPKQDTGGHWIPVKNLRTGKSDSMWVDNNEDVELDESFVDFISSRFGDIHRIDEAARSMFDTGPYEFAQGNKPRGRGVWAFSETDPNSQHFKFTDAVMSGNVTYEQAKKWAKKQFPNATTIYVLP